MHYLTEQIDEMNGRMSSAQIKEKMNEWFQAWEIDSLSEKVGKFMREKLFSKLGKGICYGRDGEAIVEFQGGNREKPGNLFPNLRNVRPLDRLIHLSIY